MLPGTQGAAGAALGAERRLSTTPEPQLQPRLQRASGKPRVKHTHKYEFVFSFVRTWVQTLNYGILNVQSAGYY
jgi:hypothetical protein